MNINYRSEFSELIKSLNMDHTSYRCLERLIDVVENTCSLTDLERILEAYKIGE